MSFAVDLSTNPHVVLCLFPWVGRHLGSFAHASSGEGIRQSWISILPSQTNTTGLSSCDHDLLCCCQALQLKGLGPWADGVERRARIRLPASGFLNRSGPAKITHEFHRGMLQRLRLHCGNRAAVHGAGCSC